MCDKCECNDGFCGLHCNNFEYCSCEGCEKIRKFPINFGDTYINYNKEQFLILGTMESDDEYYAKSKDGEYLFFFRYETRIIDNKLFYRGEKIK